MPTRKSSEKPAADAERDSDAVTPKKTRTGRTKRVRVSSEPLTPEEHAKAQDVALAEYAQRGNVAAACRKAQISRNTFYRWQEHDEVFAVRYGQAKADYCDKLRQEIDRRATTGVLEPVASAGKVVAHVRKYSDTLLIFQAKAHMPEYRDKLDVKAHLQAGSDDDGTDDNAAAALARGFLLSLGSLATQRQSDPDGSGASGE